MLPAAAGTVLAWSHRLVSPSYVAELGPIFVMPQAPLFPSVTSPTGVSSASSFDIILEKCRDLVSERVSDALTEMFDEADEALTAFGSLSRDPETSKLYEVTRNKVISKREAIVTQFRIRFLREFQERVNRVKTIGGKFTEIDLSSLEPVAEDDLNESLKFDAMASRLRQYCDEELLALDQRVGVLVGDADLQSKDNPFTPQAIVDAYKHTCRQIDSNVDVRMVLLKLFDDHVLDEIRSVYKAVNALLIKNSILPKIRFSVERRKDRRRAPSGEQRPGNVSRAAETDNIPQELTNTNLGGGMNQMDTMTLDIVAMLFDDLFDDPKIPTSVKGLIGRLQTPMLKLVIADKSFFSRKSHPARQMLDKLGELSTSLPAAIKESDPIYGNLESIIQSFIEGFKDDINIFDGLHQQLDTLIVEMNERAKQETQGIARQLNQQEKLALAKTVAQAEIKARLRASAVPQLIVEFLVQHWVRLLVVTHVKEGEQSETWKNALKTVDVLLWSGVRKETHEERRKMIAVLPNLLKTLSDGLAYAGIDDEIRVIFFSDLRKLHTAIFGRSAHPSVEARNEESVIEDGSEEAATDVASGKLETAEETESSDTVSDSEAAATIAEPDEAETSDTAEEPDALPMRDKPAEADISKEMQLDFRPAKGESAAISQLADTTTAKTAPPGEKSPTTDSLSATLEREAVPKLTESTTRTYEEPSAQLRAEMDKVMDATRTMFSDIDRFIMLGQSKDAIGVLDSRIKREPSNRDSWIKLMAIYRDEDMKDDFYRTYATFREQFGESPDS
jgi:hypothetical protein